MVTIQRETDFKLPMSEFLYIGMVDPKPAQDAAHQSARFPIMKREFVEAIDLLN
jgi:hypothetical protein